MHYVYVLEWPSQTMSTLSDILLIATQVKSPFVLDRSMFSPFDSASFVELLVGCSPMSANDLLGHLCDGVALPSEEQLNPSRAMAS